MPEMMVAVSIMVVVTAVVAGLFVQVRKMISITQWGVETRAQLRATVDALSQDLQNLDDSSYFLMLNRDYGGAAAVLYPGDVPNPSRTFWADRIAFVAHGPFNGLNFDSTTGQPPPIGATARVYYGHDLWTHELPDLVWERQIVGLGANLLSLGFFGYPQWSGGFDRRPAVNWVMVRQAVLKLEQPAGADWNRDTEFQMLFPNSLIYNPGDLSMWIDAKLPTNGSPGSPPSGEPLTPPVGPPMIPPPSVGSMPYDWLSLLWAPRAFKIQEDGPPVRDYDPTLHQNVSPEFARNLDNTVVGSRVAAARVLVPHAARIRFQVRLSDGTIVPQTDETDAIPWQRGRLRLNEEVPTAGTPIAYLNPGTVALFRYPGGTTFDPTPLGRPSKPIPVNQTTFVWTPDKTNICWYRPGEVRPADRTAVQDLYPVGVRIRAEVYDLDRRTPDPIVVDEWLPVRWGARPQRAP